ncbi:MAG: hypothetical protein A3G33_08310 [Omnitrophica bacterium RIFCSPLOWO2_12_FULL_44_17]|uniref:DUF932 domain-containing protein n=1 Tax=Candidatus Danuiimicrobium aquiferis TaxID=1801832 RepID=A0A1G1KW74_9BACT|nr:MAG: hypothetical protein A3B72_03530 [Omnitrophica bacterium RIFCSPHIGHO2_02_FULL_45_28]OGW90527.1 MAG: hypothetical protein A3E74_03050 [Omnitrophica bacterium RIFCSPHIGHO2_12_FULL_44_12]OGW97167.1 MAG: hypothetical protein A3G33_08310 [Omnitrophica bacterium RIFCSPLOWO2_12_FULL_44_17]OGX02227.1 MAG: hypothetical protein A3J12_08095 [Omnitrophica bacterium RIFCSPLOWO2_02_FULL_44_11]
MKLEDLVKTLEQEKLRKFDYLIDSRELMAIPEIGEHHAIGFRDEDKFREISGTSRFNLMRGAHRQFAQKLDIPEKYYDRLLLHPDAWAFNVNWWFEKEPKRLFVRTFQDHGDTYGIIRAVLSERYRVIDHMDVVLSALEELRKFSGIQIESCDLTEERMYLRVSHPGVHAEVRPGDEIRAGLILSNSETGMGSLYVKPRLLRLICKNGMVTDLGVEQIHLGKKLSEEFLYSDETQRLENELIFRKVKDMVTSIFSPETFRKLVSQLQEATAVAIMEPEKAIKNIVARYSLTETHKEEILKSFIDEGDSSKYGLIQAVTYIAHSEEDPQESTRIEAIGGDILEMNQENFRELVSVPQ